MKKNVPQYSHAPKACLNKIVLHFEEATPAPCQSELCTTQKSLASQDSTATHCPNNKLQQCVKTSLLDSDWTEVVVPR